jgi:lipoprotein-anchoring transpeptidase ErfK/SrfK
MLNRTTIRIRPMAVLVALALAVFAGVLWAGPAAATAPTTLTASVTPGIIVYHGSATVKGTVTSGASPLAGAALSLLARPAGATDWAPAGSTTSAADGAFSFPAVSPSVSTDYRVVFAATSAQDAAQADVGLRVRPLVTVVFPGDLRLGGSAYVRGAVAPAHPGAAVVIERLLDGLWQPLGAATLDADSRFSFRWAPDAVGFYRLRARMDADADHYTGASRAKLVVVDRPNAHGVPMRSAHYIVIVRHEYRLYYYEHGVLIRAFNVALGRPGYRTPLGSFRIYGKRKPAGGPLGACALYYRRLGGIAIHGTNQPYLLRRPAPRDFSHGCARMLNRQVLWLYDRVPVGTHVHNLR